MVSNSTKKHIMENRYNVRDSWLKGMYIYTALGAGLFGLGIIIIPETIADLLNLPHQEPISYGIIGSVYLAFGIISILGLKSPLKFVPILLLQMSYKIIWFLGVILPLVFKGQLPQYAIINIVIFASFIIGDIIAIPFKYIFEK
jgi:hypothetical protein